MRPRHLPKQPPLPWQHPALGSVHSDVVRTSGYYVNNYQQYLAKNPFRYRCHANTCVKFPETA